MLLRNMFDYNIWLTLFLSTEVFNFDLGRANRIFHQSSVQWMISTSSVVIPRATWHLRPSHGVSTPIWLSLNCYCFAPHHKSLSLLSLVSFSTLFFPKIISRCICRMLLYMRKLAQQAPENFLKPNKNRPRSKRTRAFLCVHPPLTPHMRRSTRKVMESQFH